MHDDDSDDSYAREPEPIPDPLVPGQTLVRVQYGRCVDPRSSLDIGPIEIVGTELTFVRREPPGLFAVRDARGAESFVRPSHVSPVDDRVFFAVEGRAMRGYLLGGMYDDHSGGSLTRFDLEGVPGLGAIELDSRIIASIRIPAVEQPIEVRTHAGETYCGRPMRAWWVGPSLKINLAKAAGLHLTHMGSGPASCP